MTTVINENEYLHIQGNGETIKESWSFLSILKDMEKQGFKFVIPNGCKPFIKWLEERKIPYLAIGANFDETHAILAVAEMKEGKFRFDIVIPPDWIDNKTSVFCGIVKIQ